MDRLMQLLEKVEPTELEEMELDRLLKAYAIDHNITFDSEHGYQ